MSEPVRHFRAWAPHVVLFALWLCAGALVVWMVAPLFQPLLVAASVALLTHPVIHEPVERFCHARLGKLGFDMRRRIAATATTVLVVLLVVSPVIAMLVSALGSLGGLTDLVLGVAQRDPVQLDRLEDAIRSEIMSIHELYPKLGLGDSGIPEAARAVLVESVNFGPAFFSFIVAGTGTVAQLALALVSLAVFYSEGPRLVDRFLDFSPLSEAGQARLRERHDTVVRHMFADTISVVFVKGIALGTYIWAVDAFLGMGKLPLVPIAILAAVVTLLPLLGATMVWLPLAALLWSGGFKLGAVVLAVGSFAINFFIERAHEGVVKAFDPGEARWMSFVIFIGVVGGIVNLGAVGLIVGPMCVVVLVTLLTTWGSVYKAKGTANYLPTGHTLPPTGPAPEMKPPVED
jgi:predicted PurR-regulated permease PerM